jgi:hypothetical protein
MRFKRPTFTPAKKAKLEAELKKLFDDWIEEWNRTGAEPAVPLRVTPAKRKPAKRRRRLRA